MEVNFKIGNVSMHTFLSKILQLDSIQDVILLSNYGELLFGKHVDGLLKGDGEIARWNVIIAGLAGPLRAELLFERGRYYIHHNQLGYVIVGMKNARSLNKVKMACINVQEKLGETVVRKRVLLKMLAEAEETLKPHVIKALAPLADREVTAILIDLLQKEAQFDPQNRDKLQLSLCETLGHSSSYGALDALNEFLSEYGPGKGPLHDAVEKAARVSVQQLELEMPVTGKASDSQAGETDQKAESRTAVQPARQKHHVAEAMPEQQRIEELLGAGRKNEAISLIMQNIETAAGEKQFHRAERLRDWLIRIDSMSLREIIRAAEIIEEAKRTSISSEHVVIWRDLAQTLSSEEFSSLYHAMTPRNYADGEMVATQGEFLSSLFFVNSGRVQLYAVSQDREIPLKIIGPGEIMGVGTFFEISVWTVNARSMGAEISVLSWEKLQGQKEAYPALYSKLMDFCARFQSPDTLFSRTRRTRRRFERKKTSGRATIILLDEQGKETGIGAKGDLLDISRGGLSFSLRFSKKKNAAALLGKQIRVNIRTDASRTSFSCNAVVKAVRCHDFVGNDYSVHVEFQDELSQMEMQQVAGKGK